MRKPIIAVLANIVFDADYMFAGYPRVILNEDYTRSIEQAGGIPLVIAPTTNLEVLDEQLALCDAVFFTGGQDVNPLLYGEEPELKMGNPSPERDAFEMAVHDRVKVLGKSIFGICRGMQLLNVYYGGTLHQDNSGFNATIRHMQSSNPACPIHHANVMPGSFLEKALGKQTITINSFHHQSVKDLAPGFKVAAIAPDGAVEAIEKEHSPVFIAATQWHPEMMSRSSDDAQRIFKYFIERVKDMLQ